MKKKFPVLAACVCLTLFASAQKGSILVGGDINISSSKSTFTSTSPSSTSKNSTFALNPTIGYQIDQNCAIAVDAKAVYWLGADANGGELMKVAK